MDADHREYVWVFMRQLRKKLEQNPSQPRYLLTKPWIGYRFRPIAQAEVEQV